MTTKRHSIFGPQVVENLAPSGERKVHFHLRFFLSQPVNRSIWVLQKTMCHNCFANWMCCVGRKTLITPIGRRKHGKRTYEWVQLECDARSILQLGAFRRNRRDRSRTLVKASRSHIDANGVARFKGSPGSRSDSSQCHSHRFAQSFAYVSRRSLSNCDAFDFRPLETIVQGLFDARYIEDSDLAQKLVWILGLPHFHHHEKRSVTKTASSISLSKQGGLHPSPSFVMSNLSRRGQSSSPSGKR